jgi:putative transposase
MAKATALDKARRVRQHPKPKSRSASIGPDGPKHPGDRQLYDKRGRPDAGARLRADYPKHKVATFCAALWPTFTLPLTAVYVALGVTRDGQREVLGLWIAENEGAKFWLSVMNELRNRGLQDILIAVVDGLKGFPEAITAAFPDAMVQTCIVHLVRHSLNFCSWKDRKAVAADLRRIYSAPTADMAEAELDTFEEKWAVKYASIAPAWRRAWQEVIPFFGFDPAIRKIIYTTNAIESLNRVIRKSIKTRGSFPTDEAATKLIYLAIRNFEKDGRNVREWFAARNQFAIMFAERFDA